MGARNRARIGLLYRPTRLHRLAEFIHWSQFLGSINVKKYGLWQQCSADGWRNFYTCTKSYGAMNVNDPVIIQPILVNWVAKILIKLFLENVEIFHNCLKLPFFGLKIRLLFTALFRIRFRIWIQIRIQNVYFGSKSGQKFRVLTDPVLDPDPQLCKKDYFWGRGTERSFC